MQGHTTVHNTCGTEDLVSVVENGILEKKGMKQGSTSKDVTRARTWPGAMERMGIGKATCSVLLAESEIQTDNG